MNKIKLVILIALIFSTNSSFASIGGSKVHGSDYPVLFQNITVPVDAGKIPISREAKDNMVSIYNMKKGEAVSSNILFLVHTGDSSIRNAAEKAGIRKIHFVEVKKMSVFVPLLFIPIYVSKFKTIVYGV
jgi:hypothetical protein